jgi:hypothetical protein
MVRITFVLQALKFHLMCICRKFPGGTGVSHYRPNESFMEGQFTVSVVDCPSLFLIDFNVPVLTPGRHST